MSRRVDAIPWSSSPACSLALLGLVACVPVLVGEVASGADPVVGPRLETVEPLTLLRDSETLSGMRSARFTGLNRPLDRAAQAATDDRLSWGRSYVSYYPLDSGLWAGVPSESVSGVRGGIGAGQVVDIRFSMGRPAGASGDPDVRSMWHGNATGVDHDALGRAVYGGTATPLEATNIRQRDRATRQDTTISTAAMSRNASLPVSIAQHALPFHAVTTRSATDVPPGTADAEPAADSMEHPAYRQARLRGIAERAMERARTDRTE